MTAALSSEAPRTVESVLERLDDPRVIASLDNLLDHLDLLAVLVVGLDGMVSRSEVIGDALIGGLGELREAAANATAGASPAPGEILAGVVTLSTLLPRVAPLLKDVVESGAVERVLDSSLTTPIVVDQVARIGRGMAAGAEKAASDPFKVPGLVGLVRLLKDPDINRALSFVLGSLKAIGSELRAETPPAVTS